MSDMSNVEKNKLLPDYGCRRYMPSNDIFGSISPFNIFFVERNETWSAVAVRAYEENIKSAVSYFIYHFGESNIEGKIKNYKDMGVNPISILSWHNNIFDQVRQSFITGAYYNAGNGVGALGERILNHLVIRLRDYYRSDQYYKTISKNGVSFINWDNMLNFLVSCGIFNCSVKENFKKLKRIRNDISHFKENFDDILEQRDAALKGIKIMAEIINQLFPARGSNHWFIQGSGPHSFIKKECEDKPFIKEFYLPNLPFVGPYFSYDGKANIYDYENYGDGSWTDEEFANCYRSATPEQKYKVPEAISLATQHLRS